MEKKQDQTLVPATNAGKIAWVMIIFSVSLLKSYPEMHCFAFSPLYIPLSSCFAFCATLDCACWSKPGAKPCGIPSAAGDRQPEPGAGFRAMPRSPEAVSGMLNPPAVARGIYWCWEVVAWDCQEKKDM